MVAPRCRRQRARLATRWLVATGLLAAACSTNPVTGNREFVLVSAAQEKQLGREAADQVAEQMGLIEDEALVGYVAALGQRVAQHSPRRDVEYNFHVVDMQEPNAFALPGGYIYVSRGLLALANDEAELANVLGHEIAHVAARHAVQRQTRAVGVGLVLLPAAFGGALLGSVLGMPGDLVSAAVNAPLQMLGVGLIAAYSRDQEREADRVGQEMAARAGIDPRGLTDFMDTLEAYEKVQTRETQRPSFFDSHPTTPERVENTAQRATALGWTRQPGIAPDRRAFLERIEGLLLGANPAEGIFDDQQFLHPDLDFTVTFPEGWKTLNARAGVGGIAPASDAQVLLELQGSGSDPRAAANAALEQLDAQVTLKVDESEALQIGPHAGHRVRVTATKGRESAPLEITWIIKDGLVYRFTAAALPAVFDSYRSSMRAVPESFRTLSPMERDAIREKRLRLATTRGGESLASLARRTRNAWSDAETAVANELVEGGALDAGLLVKIAVPEPYQTQPPRPRASE